MKATGWFSRASWGGSSSRARTKGPFGAARHRCKQLVSCAALLPWLLACSACAVLDPPVSRMVNGVVSDGRFIEADAYALYALAALREARGNWDEALELYRRAYALDARGPELKTRMGAVACRLRRFALADGFFADALEADERYGPLWFELAQCRKERGDLVGAQDAALHALRLDPERVEISLLCADLAELRGDAASAWRLRDALSTHAPHSLPAQQAILAAAERASDPARAARARQALEQLQNRRGEAPAALGLTQALAALRRGDAATARVEAERLLGADPGDADALVVALCAADLEQDQAAFTRLLQQSSDFGTALSPELLGLLESLLARRVSAQAARLVRAQP